MQRAYETYAKAEHSTEVIQRIYFNSISVLGKVFGYMGCNMKETTEIQLHHNYFNRDTSFHPGPGMVSCD
jgi:hypothetical protein